MTTVDYLEEIQSRAKRDAALRQALFATRQDRDPLQAFCRKCRELGYPVYEMDIIAVGEEFHAAMKRSTNGGGENSPMLDGQDDFYELFFASL